MILKLHNLDKWVVKYFVSEDETYRDTKKRRKNTEKCTIQYLFSMSVSFPYHFSIFSVSEFFIGKLYKYHSIKCFIRKFFKGQICAVLQTTVLRKSADMPLRS